jgi:LmbE family N-acetylglucosaminyl deacetylase
MGKSVLAVAAHPDDIEFIMAGTMMRLAAAGYALHYITIADGSCGTTRHDVETIARMRRGEAMEAAKMLGATFHESLTRDLEIFYEKKTLARLASVVREAAPSIVLTHSPQDYMEDHMTAGRLAVTAAFSRGMPNFPVDPPRGPVEGEVTVYHGQPHGNRDGLWNPVRPTHFVDVTDLIERKVRVLSCHKSQKEWLDVSQGLDSYLQAMKDLNAEVGRWSGRFEYAEGWRRRSHLGFCGPSADPLAEALEARVRVEAAF